MRCEAFDFRSGTDGWVVSKEVELFSRCWLRPDRGRIDPYWRTLSGGLRRFPLRCIAFKRIAAMTDKPSVMKGSPDLPEALDRREFSVTRKGYDKKEVKAFLAEIEGNFRELEKWAEQTKSRLAVAEDNGSKARVDEAMVAVFDAKDRVLERARLQAEKIEADARERADAIESGANVPADADEAAGALLADAERRAAEIVADADRRAAEVTSVIAGSGDTVALVTERDRLAGEVTQLTNALAAAQATPTELSENVEGLRHERDEILAQIEQARADQGVAAAGVIAEAQEEARRMIEAAQATTTPVTEVSILDAARAEADRLIQDARGEAATLVQKATRNVEESEVLKAGLSERVALLDAPGAAGANLAEQLQVSAQSKADEVVQNAEATASGIRDEANRAREQADLDRLEAARKASAAQRQADELVADAEERVQAILAGIKEQSEEARREAEEDVTRYSEKLHAEADAALSSAEKVAAERSKDLDQLAAELQQREADIVATEERTGSDLVDANAALARLRSQAEQLEARLGEQRELGDQVRAEAEQAAARIRAEAESHGERVADATDAPVRVAEAQADEIVADARRLHDEAESVRKAAAEQSDKARDEALLIRAKADEDAEATRGEAEAVRRRADLYVASTVEEANEALNSMAGEVVEQIEYRLSEAAEAEQRAAKTLTDAESSVEMAQDREASLAEGAAKAEQRIEAVDNIVKQAEETLKDAYQQGERMRSDVATESQRITEEARTEADVMRAAAAEAAEVAEKQQADANETRKAADQEAAELEGRRAELDRIAVDQKVASDKLAQRIVEMEAAEQDDEELPNDEELPAEDEDDDVDDEESTPPVSDDDDDDDDDRVGGRTRYERKSAKLPSMGAEASKVVGSLEGFRKSLRGA
ncbi:MAG: hypothetical protein BMS9Abin07_0397 [Acidimicrobiia bacterium]|nr:MAG: hypothetical protein BMS9Abin07_0397 [Acidimicrobiia bacterium]